MATPIARAPPLPWALLGPAPAVRLASRGRLRSMAASGEGAAAAGSVLRTCKNCKQQYDPSVNHPSACRYHTAHFGGETKRKFESVYAGGTMDTPDSGKVFQYWHCCGSEDPFDAHTEKKSMDIEKALAIVVLVSAALLLSGHQQPVSAQVFCRSQFNLANEACSMRNFIPRRGGLPRPLQMNETAAATTTTSTAAATTSSSVSQQGLQSRSSDDDDDDDSHGSRRRSRHRHQHRHSEEGEGEDPRDTACCRRLMGLDNSCACQATARLPAFMNSVRHVITLTPVEGCEISFECPGPLF